MSDHENKDNLEYGKMPVRSDVMKTTFKQNGNDLIFSLEGIIDYESQDSLRYELTKMIEQNRTLNPRLIYDLAHLEFVGSCGITNLIQTLKEAGEISGKRTCVRSAKSEFKQIMKALDNTLTFEFEEDSQHYNNCVSLFSKSIPTKQTGNA